MESQQLLDDLIPASEQEKGDATQNGRMRAAGQVRPPLEFFEAVLANMGEGVYTIDESGCVTSMNPAAEKMLGWTFDEISGKKMHDVAHYKYRDGPPFPADKCVGIQNLTAGTRITDYEDFFVRKDGSYFDVTYSASPIHTPDGIIGWVMVF